MTDDFAVLDYKRFRRKIMREPICEPGPDQYVDECHYSKTGWGIWNRTGGCTCKPAKPPKEIR